MATAPSLANFLKSRAEVVALAPSFPQTNFSCRPSTPPEALILFTAMMVPLMTATPVDPYAPVVPAIAPMTIGPDDALAVSAPNGRAVAVRPATKRIPTDLIFFKVPPRRSFGRLATLGKSMVRIKLSDNLRPPTGGCQGALAGNLVNQAVSDCPTSCPGRRRRSADTSFTRGGQSRPPLVMRPALRRSTFGARDGHGTGSTGAVK